MILADNHCHISKEYFENPLEEIRALKSDSGLEYITIMGVDYNNDVENLEYKRQFNDPFLKVGIGLHPAEVIELGDLATQELARVLQLIVDNKDDIDYIGEIGIDYTYPNAEKFKEMQKTAFKQLCLMAHYMHKPVSIHARGGNAMADVLEIIAEVSTPDRFNGYIHCFTGTFEDAEAFIQRGFKLGIGGIITFKKSDDLRETVQRIVRSFPGRQLDDLVGLETDTPYLSPEPNRSKTNNPRNIHVIADYVRSFLI
jgi:TatD DNase family protein